MNATVPAAREPVLTPSPNPAKPPQVTEADRVSALIQIMAGQSSAGAVTRAEEVAARAWGLALAMAQLEADGITREAALAMVRANGGTAEGALERAAAA